MNERILVPVLFFGIFLVFVGIILRAAVTVSRKSRANVKRLAEHLGLTVQEQKPVLGFHPTPEATGELRGKRLRLYNYSTGSGKSRTTWSAVAATPRADGGLTFVITREGLGTTLQRAFGTREIQVGDAAFDREWFVRTNRPEYFAAALIPEICEKMRGFPGRWQLEDGVVRYVEQGVFSDDERCERFARAVEALCDLADIAEVHAQQGRAT